MTPRDVMELPANEAIVFFGGAKPIKCLQSAYYQDERFLEMTKTALVVTRNQSKLYTSEWEEGDSYKEKKEEEGLGLIIELNSKEDQQSLKMN